MGFHDFIKSAISREAYHEISTLCWELQKQERIGFGAMFSVYEDLIRDDESSLALAIYRNTAATNPLKAIGAYFAANLAAEEGDIFKCKEELKFALSTFQKNGATLITDKSSLHVAQTVQRQFVLITPELDLSGTLPTSLDTSSIHRTPDTQNFFILSSCNGIYFDRFGEGFLSSLPSEHFCHIHIINPSKGFEEKKRRLLKQFPNMQFTTEIGPEEATYYACRRFQIVGSLMQHYRKAAFVSDIDTYLFETISDFDNPSEFSTALFTRKQTAPMLLMHLSLSFYNFSLSTLAFLDSLDRYLTEHLRHQYPWMLDQCAYLTCALKHAQEDDDFTFRNLGEIFPKGLPRFQTNQPSTTEEKYKLRGFW